MSFFEQERDFISRRAAWPEWVRLPPLVEAAVRAEIPPDDEGQFEPKSRVNTSRAGRILIGVGLGVAAFGGLATALGVAWMDQSRDLAQGYAAVLTGVGITGMALGGVSIAVGLPLSLRSSRGSP